jgi:tRNA-2-methylthio-N6-dimethylallyladenosine synthase
MKKYFLHTMGCQMNRADSDSMGRSLRQSGLTAAAAREDADVIIINTCTVRRNVELKAFAYIGRLQQLKEKKPALKIIVAGCAAQRLGEQLQKKFPFVDLVVGAQAAADFSELLRPLVPCVPGAAEAVSDAYATGSPATAFVTIMRGCDNFCSYCIVPHVRGRETSRAASEILAEIESLAATGVKEVTLLGQNVNSYAGKTHHGSMDFPGLLRAVSAIEGIRRIRFTTSHPKDLSEKLMHVMATTDKVCRHLHLPLQSGSDRILKAMNRNYTAADYARLASRLRETLPSVALTTDIMAGFPGETDEDFRATLRLVETTGFDSLFAYKYSPREGTAAFALPDDISAELKETRCAEILSLAANISAQKNAALLHTLQEVLVEKREADLCTGRTGANTKVYFFSEDPEITAGSFADIRITECRITTLVGKVEKRGGGQFYF